MRKSSPDFDPAIPDPWDDPEDHIDCLFWFDAIENREFELLARYCRESPTYDRRVAKALADKIAPQTRGGDPFVWRKANGRPRGGAKPPSIAVVATQLRTGSVEPGTWSWLGEQFNPRSPGDSHFVRARNRKGPSVAAKKRVATIFLGFRIEAKRREFAKKGPGYEQLEYTLDHFVRGADTRYKTMSRSRARRAYEEYMKHCGRMTLKVKRRTR